MNAYYKILKSSSSCRTKHVCECFICILLCRASEDEIRISQFDFFLGGETRKTFELDSQSSRIQAVFTLSKLLSSSSGLVLGGAGGFQRAGGLCIRDVTVILDTEVGRDDTSVCHMLHDHINTTKKKSWFILNFWLMGEKGSKSSFCESYYISDKELQLQLKQLWSNFTV